MRYPYFWDKEKRFTFLLQVGRKITFYTSKPNREVEDFHQRCIEAKNWTSSIHRDLMKFLCMCTNKSFGNDFSDLLDFAVSLQIFFQAMPPYLKNIIKHPTHFILLKFPSLFMSVFDVVRRSPLLVTQMGLQNYF
ncbi:hypothetical protein JTE90_009143 [Oedothorax gibbosus]|uniref:KEN domain-containing protein n=1 Tax=Oedothorax gibbosus TaxID=931172 RepID=A0AAV6TVK4_9ARAC|nr:hypothetical protein JTE90_009143 [Oedothorax gibbosus]